MRANLKQLQSYESLKTDYCFINIEDYGFYSDGSIGACCTDEFGMFSANIDINGVISSK